MKITRCSKGFIAISLSFIILSGILDEPVLLAAGIVPGLFLFIRAGVFLKGITEVKQTVRCERTFEKTFIRQGKWNQVNVLVRFHVPYGFRVLYEDHIPSWCRKESGENCSGWCPDGFHEISLSYRFIPAYHGNISHPGGRMRIRDRFFESSCAVQETEKPLSFLVQPWPLFDLTKKPKAGHDLERIGPVKGYSIRQFREYLPGDDLRHVDWKISAKRGSLYVREYATPAEERPMIIVDLPDMEQDTDMEAFTRMVASLSGFAESIIAQKEPVSLLLISGPNMTDIFYEGRDMSACLSIIRERIHPFPRIFYLYRFMMRADLRRQIHRLDSVLTRESVHEPDRLFLTRIRDIRMNHLPYIRSSRFQSAVSAILFSCRLYEIILYSLCDGDVSHIREIASLAHQQNIPFSVRTPKRSNHSFHIPDSLRGEMVEVV